MVSVLTHSRFGLSENRWKDESDKLSLVFVNKCLWDYLLYSGARFVNNKRVLMPKTSARNVSPVPSSHLYSCMYFDINPEFSLPSFFVFVELIPDIDQSKKEQTVVMHDNLYKLFYSWRLSQKIYDFPLKMTSTMFVHLTTVLIRSESELIYESISGDLSIILNAVQTGVLVRLDTPFYLTIHPSHELSDSEHTLPKHWLFSPLICQPVSQGLITSQTKIVLLPPNHFKSIEYNVLMDESITSKTSNSLDMLFRPNAIALSTESIQDALFQTSNPTKNSLCFSLPTFSDSDNDSDIDSVPVFQPQWPINISIFSKHPHILEWDDALCALTSFKTLALLGIFSSDYVELSNPEMDENKNSIVVRIFGDDGNMVDDDFVFFVSPVLAFNINSNGMRGDLKVVRLKEKPKIAQNVTVARVPGKINYDRNYLEAALNGLKKWMEADSR
ncbi:hypothetical protein HK096_002402, partial [Nowakowskiella sp. JEL0078]